MYKRQGIITGAFILEQLGGRLTLILDRRASMSAPWLSILSLLIVGILLIVLLISCLLYTSPSAVRRFLQPYDERNWKWRGVKHPVSG